jgi:hypothetical protein
MPDTDMELQIVSHFLRYINIYIPIDSLTANTA